jgi:hypothetical protein
MVNKINMVANSATRVVVVVPYVTNGQHGTTCPSGSPRCRPPCHEPVPRSSAQCQTERSPPNAPTWQSPERSSSSSHVEFGARSQGTPSNQTDTRPDQSLRIERPYREVQSLRPSPQVNSQALDDQCRVSDITVCHPAKSPLQVRVPQTKPVPVFLEGPRSSDQGRLSRDIALRKPRQSARRWVFGIWTRNRRRF